MSWSDRPKRRAVQKINELIEKIKSIPTFDRLVFFKITDLYALDAKIWKKILS